MSKYRLIAGKHVERDPATKKKTKYNQGDIVSSVLPLDEMFQQKFEKVGRTSPPAAQEAVQEVPQDVETPEPDEDTPEADEDVVEDPGDSQEITLKAVHKGAGRWDVMKVVDGEVTDETVNDEFLKKDEAKALAAAGWPIEEE